MMFAMTCVMVSSQNKKAWINTGSSYVEITTFSDEDTITANQAEYIIQINAAQNYPTTQDFMVVIDSVDVPNLSVQLSGSKFNNTYSDIGSPVTWAGTTSDTTIVISNTNENRYRYYRATFTWTSGEAKLSEAAFKLFYE